MYDQPCSRCCQCRLLSENERSLIPRNFSELMHLVSNSANTAVRNAARQQQHVLQLQLISEDWPAITLELAGTALAAAEQLQQLQAGQQAQLQQQQGAENDAADEGMEFEDPAAAGVLAGTGAVDDEGARMSEESARGVLRFAAHWALCLRALGLMPSHEWCVDDEEEAEWARWAAAQLPAAVFFAYLFFTILQHWPIAVCLLDSSFCVSAAIQLTSVHADWLLCTSTMLANSTWLLLFLQAADHAGQGHPPVCPAPHPTTRHLAASTPLPVPLAPRPARIPVTSPT
jgi:hypothetical protein